MEIEELEWESNNKNSSYSIVKEELKDWRDILDEWLSEARALRAKEQSR